MELLFSCSILPVGFGNDVRIAKSSVVFLLYDEIFGEAEAISAGLSECFKLFISRHHLCKLNETIFGRVFVELQETSGVE